MKQEIIASQCEPPALVSVATFARQIGRTPVTVWRWQKLGWLDASINIASRPYLSREAIKRFTARATAGEFARAPHAPRKVKAEVQA
jgi:transposase-like protein